MRHILLLLTILSVGTIYGQDILPAVQVTESDSNYGVASMNVYSSNETFWKRKKPAYKKTVYWKRHITQNVLGAVSLVAGAGLWFPSIGASVAAGECDKLTTAGIIGGGCFVLASIPLFISAHHNKVKAHRVSLGADYITAPVAIGGNRREVQPALTLRFNF